MRLKAEAKAKVVQKSRHWPLIDVLLGFRPAPGSGTARHESSGPGSGGIEGSAGTGDDVHGSTTFLIYVIGRFVPASPDTLSLEPCGKIGYA